MDVVCSENTVHLQLMYMIPSYRISKELRQKQRFQNKTMDEIPPSELEGIRDRILKLQSDSPEVSIVVIAWNEERNLLCTLDSLSDLKPSYAIEIIVVDKIQQIKRPRR